MLSVPCNPASNSQAERYVQNVCNLKRLNFRNLNFRNGIKQLYFAVWKDASSYNGIEYYILISKASYQNKKKIDNFEH